MTSPTEKFWEQKPLNEMSRDEWEALCDGCGKCCLHKLIDEDADDVAEEVLFTDIACQLLNNATAQCSDYQHRLAQVPDCVVLSPDNLAQVYYMPSSCAYRRLAEGRGLATWHPLLNKGSRGPMRAAGISAAGRSVSEANYHGELEDRIVTWPLKDTEG
ncbi:YcgN family cysteine cluster protein [Thalassospira xiamenensis]|nr:YcgN family cysteine cluster protein [Thalassospira xiamenensis]